MTPLSYAILRLLCLLWPPSAMEAAMPSAVDILAILARHDDRIALALDNGGYAAGRDPVTGERHEFCACPAAPAHPYSFENIARRSVWRRWVAAEHIGPRERWPAWWTWPGGAEEPSARERLGS